MIVIMRDVAASGAYYISAAADRIIAHPTSVTGSIGVIMPLVNVAPLAEKFGISVASIKLMRCIPDSCRLSLMAEI